MMTRQDVPQPLSLLEQVQQQANRITELSARMDRMENLMRRVLGDFNQAQAAESGPPVVFTTVGVGGSRS